MSHTPPTASPPAHHVSWSKEVIQFLQNIGDGCGYFNPRALGERPGTAVQVTRTVSRHEVPTDTEMVLKELNLADKPEEWRKQFCELQISALKQLRHPHLARAHKAFGGMDDSIWFVEYDLHRCNMSAAVKNHDHKRLPEEKGRRWCKQILEGLMFLHENQWPHRDLKMENILITHADVVVITDFAFTQEQKTGLPNPGTGSLTYAAPEVLRHLSCNPFKADVWALGVIFFAMHADNRLFHEESDRTSVEAEHRLLSSRIQRAGFSSSLKSLITGMMMKDPVERMELSDMTQHAWFAGNVSKCH